MSLDARYEAKQLLVHYFQLALKPVPGHRELDEIERIVDLIIEAAMQEAQLLISRSVNPKALE